MKKFLYVFCTLIIIIIIIIVVSKISFNMGKTSRIGSAAYYLGRESYVNDYFKNEDWSKSAYIFFKNEPISIYDNNSGEDETPINLAIKAIYWLEDENVFLPEGTRELMFQSNYSEKRGKYYVSIFPVGENSRFTLSYDNALASSGEGVNKEQAMKNAIKDLARMLR